MVGQGFTDIFCVECIRRIMKSTISTKEKKKILEQKLEVSELRVKEIKKQLKEIERNK